MNSRKTENIKIKYQLKSKQSESSEQLKLSLAKQLTDIRNSKHQIYLEDKNDTTKNVSNKIYISLDKFLNIGENKKKQCYTLLAKMNMPYCWRFNGGRNC